MGVEIYFPSYMELLDIPFNITIIIISTIFDILFGFILYLKYLSQKNELKEAKYLKFAAIVFWILPACRILCPKTMLITPPTLWDKFVFITFQTLEKGSLNLLSFLGYGLFLFKYGFKNRKRFGLSLVLAGSFGMIYYILNFIRSYYSRVYDILPFLEPLPIFPNIIYDFIAFDLYPYLTLSFIVIHGFKNSDNLLILAGTGEFLRSIIIPYITTVYPSYIISFSFGGSFIIMTFFLILITYWYGNYLRKKKIKEKLSVDALKNRINIE